MLLVLKLKKHVTVEMRRIAHEMTTTKQMMSYTNSLPQLLWI